MKVRISVMVLSVIVIGALSLSPLARDYNSGGSDHAVNPETEYSTGSRDATGDGLRSFGFHRTAQIEATVNCNGTAGAGYYSGPGPGPTVSFESPPGSDVEYLYGMAVWIGAVVGRDTLVSVGADGWSTFGGEMFPPGWPYEGSVAEIDFMADHSLISNCVDTFTDGVDYDYFGRPHRPLGLDIILVSYSWDQPNLDGIVVYDLGMKNIGSRTIHDAYVGVYVDADVCFDCDGTGGFTDDIAGSIPEHQIGYVIDNDGDFSPVGYPPALTPRILAMKWLHSSFEATDTSFNWWVSNANVSLDFGPRLKKETFRDFGTGGLGTPEGDVNKYYLLSHPEWDYDQIQTASIAPDDTLWLYPNQSIADNVSDGYDARFLMSVGPFDLPPGAMERVLFAVFTADSVHIDSTNADNLPDNPDTYLANLNFDNVLANALVADSLGQLIIGAPYPVFAVYGLRISDKTDSTVTVNWQRSGFQSIDGYNVYLSEVPPELLPYPGIPAPWLEPEELVLVDQVPSAQMEYTFEGLDPAAIYFVNIAPVADGVVGNTGRTIFVRLASSASQGPVISAEYVFIQESEPTTIDWSAPQGVMVDHYHLYRGSSAWASNKYYPFYDEGQAANSITPFDSFYIAPEDKTYYYYAMEPLTEVDASTTSFFDLAPNDNDVYFVSAIDEFGFETPFSDEVQLHFIEPRTKDILVIADKHIPASGVSIPSLREVYDSLLLGYDYDFYSIGDTLEFGDCADGFTWCVDWRDFMRYRVVIVDGGLADDALSAYYEDRMLGYTRYLLSGGTLVAFGPLTRLSDQSGSTDPDIYATDHWFVQRFFGIDSSAFMFWGYCAGDASCHQYTGFQWAESVDGSMADLLYDPVNAPYTGIVDAVWPCGQCAPEVASFKVNDDAQVTHVARTLYPGTSMMEGEPIGLFVENEGTKVWRFGFHLWYMEQPDARSLIETIIPPPLGRVEIDPDTISAFEANAIEPDTMIIYFGDLGDGHTIADIDQTSLLVNGALSLTSVEIVPAHLGFTGEVVSLKLPIPDFLAGYRPAWGTTSRDYVLSGLFTDGDSLIAKGWFVLIGHRAGDVTRDGSVDIADLTFVIDFMFQGGPAPFSASSADVNADCTVDIADLVYMIDYFFIGGAAPQPGCVSN